MKIRIGRVIVGAVALTSAAVMMTVGSASAAADEYHHWTKPGVDVQIWEHDDVIRVTDTAANGHSAAVTAVDCHGHGYTLYASMGKGSWSYRSASGYGTTFNLAECQVRVKLWGDGNVPQYYQYSYNNDH
ncbi:hypothetical protein ACWDSD_39985 [Streptomyces spiralis]